MNDNVLIVDEDKSVLKALNRVLRKEVYRVYLAASAEEALTILEAVPCKVVISEHILPGMNGTDFLATVKVRFPDVVRVMLTGFLTRETAVSAINDAEVYRLFTKPWDEAVLKQTVHSAVAKYDAARLHIRQLSRLHERNARLVLERAFPGIGRVERDEKGRFQLAALSEREAAEIAQLIESLPYEA